MVLKEIFGMEGDEIVGGWRKLLNEELCNLYASPSIIRIILARHEACTGRRKCIQGLVRKS
jgi:hypothetical protein